MGKDSITTMRTGYMATTKFTPKNKATLPKWHQDAIKKFSGKQNLPSAGGLAVPVEAQKIDSKTKKLCDDASKQIKSQVQSFTNNCVNEKNKKGWKF